MGEGKKSLLHCFYSLISYPISASREFLAETTNQGRSLAEATPPSRADVSISPQAVPATPPLYSPSVMMAEHHMRAPSIQSPAHPVTPQSIQSPMPLRSSGSMTPRAEEPFSGAEATSSGLVSPQISPLRREETTVGWGTDRWEQLRRDYNHSPQPSMPVEPLIVPPPPPPPIEYPIIMAASNPPSSTPNNGMIIAPPPPPRPPYVPTQMQTVPEIIQPTVSTPPSANPPVSAIPPAAPPPFASVSASMRSATVPPVTPRREVKDVSRSLSYKEMICMT